VNDYGGRCGGYDRTLCGGCEVVQRGLLKTKDAVPSALAAAVPHDPSGRYLASMGACFPLFPRQDFNGLPASPVHEDGTVSAAVARHVIDVLHRPFKRLGCIDELCTETQTRQ